VAEKKEEKKDEDVRATTAPDPKDNPITPDDASE
jgi:hypothetical protein